MRGRNQRLENLADDKTASTTDLSDNSSTSYDIRFFLRWVRLAKKAAKDHWDDARAAWDEYENRKTPGEIAQTNDTQKVKRVYPIYWASCKTIEPAYYSRTPKITTERAFDFNDDSAQRMSTIIERLGSHFVRTSHFDEVMSSVVQDFIHADKATAQVIREDKVEKVFERVPVQPYGPQMVDEQGQRLPPEQFVDASGQLVEEVHQDQEGYFTEVEVEKVVPEIKLAPVPYNEIIHTPEAKCEAEIKEKAYFFCLSEEEATKRFPKLKGEEGKPASVSWKMGRGDISTRKGDPDVVEDKNEPIGKYIEGWEIYCKPKKKVYWVSEQFPSDFLDETDDEEEFRCFYPSPPFIIGSKPSKSLYPTPAHAQLVPTLDQLHMAYSKVFHLIQGIRRRALVAGGSEELIGALNSLESGEYVACKNLEALLGPGGKLEDKVLWIPVQELVAAIGELQELRQSFKDDFFEFFGVPDIIRGVGDPIETAAAQEIKSTSAHDRFRYAKKQIARIARDLIEMGVDLEIKVYDDERIKSICGFNYMKPEHQAKFSEDLAKLRNDNERFVRVDIDTDSLSFIDQTMRAQQRAQVVQTVNNGLKEIAAIAQSSPEFVPTAMQTLLASLDGMEGGKDFSDSVKESVQALQEKMAQPQEPPPDYQGMELGIKEREIALKEQQFVVEQEDRPIKAALEQQQIDIQNKKVDLEAQVKALNSEISAIKNEKEAEAKAAKQELEAVKTALGHKIEAAYLKLDEFLGKLKLQEQFMEERRLSNEERQSSPVNLTINGEKAELQQPKKEKPKRKRTTITTPEGREFIANTEYLDDEAVN